MRSLIKCHVKNVMQDPREKEVWGWIVCLYLIYRLKVISLNISEDWMSAFKWRVVVGSALGSK